MKQKKQKKKTAGRSYEVFQKQQIEGFANKVSQNNLLEGFLNLPEIQNTGYKDFWGFTTKGVRGYVAYANPDTPVEKLRCVYDLAYYLVKRDRGEEKARDMQDDFKEDVQYIQALDRLNLTIKGLKKRDVYFADITQLLDVLEKRQPTVLAVLTASFELPFLQGTYKKEIEETTWYDAIELVISKYSPEILKNSSQTYIYALEPHIDELLIAVFLFHIGHTLITFYKEDLLEDAEKVDLEIREKIFESIKAENKTKESKEIKRYKEKLEEKDREIEKLKNALLSQKLKYEKKINKLENIQQEIKEEKEQKEISKEDSKNLDSIQKEETKTAPAKEDEYKDVELPSSKVLFVGGHQNLINKLKSEYPDWVFATGYKRFSLVNDYSGVNVIYMYSNQVSHSLFNSIYDEMPKDIPIIYVKSTNLQKLQNEMKIGYGMWQRDISEGIKRRVYGQ